jgi:hypothetical protein
LFVWLVGWLVGLGFFFLFLFVCFVIVGFIFLFLYLLCFFFLYYQLYYTHLLNPTIIPFTLPPSPVLKSIDLFTNNLLCPFSPTLSPCPHLPLPFSPNLSPDYPTLLHIDHPLTNLLYQLHTTPTSNHP